MIGTIDSEEIQKCKTMNDVTIETTHLYVDNLWIGVLIIRQMVLQNKKIFQWQILLQDAANVRNIGLRTMYTINIELHILLCSITVHL